MTALLVASVPITIFIIALISAIHYQSRYIRNLTEHVDALQAHVNALGRLQAETLKEIRAHHVCCNGSHRRNGEVPLEENVR